MTFGKDRYGSKPDSFQKCIRKINHFFNFRITEEEYVEEYIKMVYASPESRKKNMEKQMV